MITYATRECSVGKEEGWSSKISEQVDKNEQQLPESPSNRSGAGRRGWALDRGAIPGGGDEAGWAAICGVSLSTRCWTLAGWSPSPDGGR